MWHIPFYEILRGHSLEQSHPVLPREAELVDVGVAILGRAMFSLLFLVSGAMHFADYEAMVLYATAYDVPLPGVLVPFTGAMIFLGGLSILLGYEARLGAWLLVAFLVPTAVIMHRFWGLDDPNLAMVQSAHFMKNIALAGGALLLTRFGSGPGSLTRD